MTEFERLKDSYVLTIQLGLGANIGYHEVQQGNDAIHKFCENLVETSGYHESEKTEMKRELELLKETLSKEIEHHFKKR